MTAFAAKVTTTIDTQPRLLAGILARMILFFSQPACSTTSIPICHWLFQYDHRMH